MTLLPHVSMPLLFVPAAAPNGVVAMVVLEVGLLLIALGLLARGAFVMRISSVPLFLVLGLAIGDGGIAPFDISGDFVAPAAEIGAILLLFFLGLEYSAHQVVGEMRRNGRSALVDFVLNTTPGALAALILGWGPLAAVGLAGVTYVSSSGIVTQVAREMGWRGKPEWNSMVSVLVMEDLVMAPYLPVITALAGAASLVAGLTSVGIGLFVSAFVLFAGIRQFHLLNRLFDANTPAALLLTALGLALAAGGFAADRGFSSAVAAFLVGLLVTGDIATAVRQRLAPLRDVFAAVFFVFFGLETDPRLIPPVFALALLLAFVTIATKIVTIFYALQRIDAPHDGHPWRSALRGGALMGARGEFSVVVGGLVASAAFAPPEWTGLVATYVIITATVGPLLARVMDSSPRLRRAKRAQ
jgi:monovalent cation:H+ antiporter-2, CPA2 family